MNYKPIRNSMNVKSAFNSNYFSYPGFGWGYLIANEYFGFAHRAKLIQTVQNAHSCTNFHSHTVHQLAPNHNSKCVKTSKNNSMILVRLLDGIHHLHSSFCQSFNHVETVESLVTWNRTKKLTHTHAHTYTHMIAKCFFNGNLKWSF